MLGAALAAPILSGPVLGAPLAFAAPMRRPRRGTLIGPGFYVDEDTKARVHLLGIVDLDREKLERREIRLSFFAHGVTPHPLHPTRAALFEKKGPGGAEVDLVRGEVLRSISTPSDRKFYGHGAYTADGKLLFTVESLVTDGFKGVIAVRDAADFTIRGTFPTYGVAPHDVKLVEAGKVLAITNGGFDEKLGLSPSVTFVEIATQKLLERVTIEAQHLNAGHLALSARGALAVVSAPRDGLPSQEQQPGGVSIRKPGGRLVTMTSSPEITGRMIGETLSLALHEPTGILGATNPNGHVVTFWNTNTLGFVKALELPYPRGLALTLDEKYFVVSYSPSSTLALVDARTLELVRASTFEPTYMSGSHVIVHDLHAAPRT